MSVLRVLSLWAPVVAFMALLFVLSSQSDLGSIPSDWDKLMHAGAYTVLGLLSLRAFHGGWHWLSRARTGAALLLTCGYALLDEYHQSLVPGRDPSLFDWMADALGACVAVVLVGIYVALSSANRQSRSGWGES